MATVQIEISTIQLSTCENCGWATLMVTPSVYKKCGERFDRVRLITPNMEMEGADKFSAPFSV